MIEELMLDNKTLKTTVHQLLQEKEELEEQVDTLKDLESDASERTEELALKLLLIESEKKINQFDGDEDVLRNLEEAKELLEVKGQLWEKSVSEIIIDLRKSVT